MINPEVDLEQERAADYRVYAVSGSYGDIGHRPRTLYSTFGPTPDDMHPEHVAFARACREAAEDVGTNDPVHPDMVDLTASPILGNSRRRMQLLNDGVGRVAGARHSEGSAESYEATDALCSLTRDQTVPWRM